MTIFRVIFGKEMAFKLTETELIKAFEEQQKLNDISAVAYHIESDYVDIAPAVYEKLHSDDAIEEIAGDARDYADFKDVDFLVAVERITAEYARDTAKGLGLSSIYEKEDEA